MGLCSGACVCAMTQVHGGSVFNWRERINRDLCSSRYIQTHMTGIWAMG